MVSVYHDRRRSVILGGGGVFAGESTGIGFDNAGTRIALYQRTSPTQCTQTDDACCVLVLFSGAFSSFAVLHQPP